MELLERENEVLRIIDELRKAGLDLIVVGDYAVSALARHRFSVDADLVIPKHSLEAFEKILLKRL